MEASSFDFKSRTASNFDAAAVRAVQVDIRLTLVLKALTLGFKQLKVHPLSKLWFQMCLNLHPYTAVYSMLPGVTDAGAGVGGQWRRTL